MSKQKGPTVSEAFRLLKQMGWGWAWYRFGYELKKKAGWLERAFPPVMLSAEACLRQMVEPCHSIGQFADMFRNRRPRFFFDGKTLPVHRALLETIRGEAHDEVIFRANQVLEGTFLYFSRWTVRHQPVNWHWNPANGRNFPDSLHWSKLPDLSLEWGDIKYVWELSRFSFVYLLVRAYASTGDERYGEAFWRLFESWERQNPAELGVNWKCGQEMSIRLMAWVFGLYAFADLPCSTDERIFRLIKQVYVHAIHVEKHYSFALKAVRNNHAITEAAGMYTVGILFPFWRHAARLRKKGKRYLEQEGLRQIYADGSYLQHSMNYQRLVLQVYSWCLRLSELADDPFSPALHKRLHDSILFLYHCQDQMTGQLPNYGMNDGALIHPLSSSDYLDYRPTLQTLYVQLTGKKLYPSGKHDEHLFWVCGPDAIQKRDTALILRKSQRFDTGGYYVIRDGDDFALMRCATYRDRPHQADMLHLDIWSNGINLLCDAGTYSYNAPAPWMKYFQGTASHNTVMVNGADQMKKGGRFLWLDWTRSRLLAFRAEPSFSYMEGEHDGYLPYIHRRGVLRDQGIWVIIDDVFGPAGTPFRLTQQWLWGVDQVVWDEPSRSAVAMTPVGGFRLRALDCLPSDIRLYYGFEQEAIGFVAGWKSLYYGEKVPAPQWIRQAESKGPVRMVTVLAPCDQKQDVVYLPTERGLTINGRKWRLNEIGQERILSLETWGAE